LSSLLSSGKTESGIRVISALVIQALRGSYFGEVEDAKRWYLGEIFLPPKVIRRAYQLIEDCAESFNYEAMVLKVMLIRWLKVLPFFYYYYYYYYHH
jgi:hypothetical protein